MLALVSVLALGCGADLDEMACPRSLGQTDACGGDLEGSWRYVVACSDHDFTNELNGICPGVCPGIRAANVARVGVPSGALSLTADSYDLKVSLKIDLDLVVEQACGIGACSAASAALRSAMPGSSADCSGSGDCACEVTLPATSSKRGELTTSGGVMTLDSGEQYHYCVRGDTLRYRGVTGKAAGDDLITYVLHR